MATVYVGSTETFSGKSAVCVGLARQLQRDGYRVGYMKPLSTGSRMSAGAVDEDAQFFKQSLGLADPLEDMAPIGLSSEAVETLLRGGSEGDAASRLISAFGRIAEGRDVVLLEGGCNLREGSLFELAAPRVVELLQAELLVVVRYGDDLQCLDDALSAADCVGRPLAGAVLNSIPRQRMPFAQEWIKPALEARGVPVLAVLPQERLLQSMCVGELAQLLSGEVLCGQERLEGLVEHLMVGAMGVDSALTHFRRKPNKAVITGGDRSDIQLAALETSTKCLILTGNLRPSPVILGRAAELGVPMILVRQDTMGAVEMVERAFGKTRFHQELKVERFEEMLVDRFDYARLYAALGLR